MAVIPCRRKNVFRASLNTALAKFSLVNCSGDHSPAAPRITLPAACLTKNDKALDAVDLYEWNNAVPPNIVPILADARKPESYYWCEECDIVYVDIADPQEFEIAIRNAKEFLVDGGYLIIAIKSQSIDVTKQPEQIYKQEAKKLEKTGFKVLQLVDLEPHEEKHAFILAKK